MTKHDFLFTYSVSPFDNDLRRHRESSDNIRKKIAQINEQLWLKLSSVETTFIGTMFLHGATNEAKKKEACDKVTKVIKAVLDEHKAYMEVHVYIALMVNGLGVCVEFSV